MERVPDSLPHNAARHNLPVERTLFVGRERERTEVAQSLAAARLVTLTGVGGGGKTRLALAVAADVAGRSPDGAWLVELAAVAESALVPAAVAAALDLRIAPDADPTAGLLAFLRDRHLLLVLDNCEHLIDACATLAEALLARCPDLRILATSREPLRVAGERQHRLGPLAVPDPASLPPLADLARVPSVRLFQERAQAADPAFQLSPLNAATVAAICARLDGIPLALELAAARVRALALEQILERLDDTVRLLTGGSRAGPTRQQTLRATFEWGDALLLSDERVLFRRLAVFAGSWDLAAAEAVCAGRDLDPSDVVDALAGLVDKSLVRADTGYRVARYRLLEPVRQFAASSLAQHGEDDALRTRHATHYLALAEHTAPALRGPEQAQWLGRLADEAGNLRAALAWAADRSAHGDPIPALRLTTALVPFWEARNDLSEGRGRLAMAIAATPPDRSDARLRALALIGASRLAFLQGEYADAAASSTEGLTLARDIDDNALIASALNELGMARRLQRDLSGATRDLNEALARCQALADRAGTALALLNLGATTRVVGDSARPTELLAKSLVIYNEEGDLRNIAIVRSMLGLAAAQEGDHDLAIEHLAASLAAHHELDDRRFIIFDLLGLADVLFKQGSRSQAARLLGAAQALGERAGTDLARVGRVTYAPFLAQAQECRREAQFDAAWAEGHALPADQIVAYALALAGAHDVRKPSPEPMPAHPAPKALTRREREIAQLLAREFSDRQIAAELSISPATASLHVHRILAKLSLRSRHQVAAWAAAEGIAPPLSD